MGHLERAKREDVSEVFNHCKNLTSTYRHHTQGKVGEGMFGRHVTTLPAEIFRNPEYRKYLDGQIPVEDRAKEMNRLLKRLEWFDFTKSGGCW